MRIDRRQLLTLAGASGVGLAATVAGVSAAPALADPKHHLDPFTLGVASSDPLHNGVVLWTRLAPDPVVADGLGGMAQYVVPVTWEIAEDERFRRIVKHGVERATPELGHSVHAEVHGLKADREYFYRFRSGNAVSPVGRTRTAPSTHDRPRSLAFVSCANYPTGHFTAYKHLAEEELDLVLHLGDYIYEGPAAGTLGRAHLPAAEIFSLADYRVRHAQYKTDPDLRLAHARFPWAVTWDDHEVENNYADEISEVVGGGALAACGEEGTGQTLTERQQTMFMAGWQWGPPPNFNPINPTAGFPTQSNQMQLIYESLFVFNLLDSSLVPQLGAALETPDDHTFLVRLQPGATWQDGKPVTSDDVVYTFQLARRHTEAPYAAAWEYLADVTKTDDKTVTFALNPKRLNPGMAKTYLSQVYILPAHLWTDIEARNAKIAEYPNDQPVGSGPYKLQSYNAQQIVFVRDDNYWGKAVRGKLPAPKKIVHPIFKDNAAGNLAFERGEVDVMQQFTPQIWKMWEDKKLPVGTWYAQPPYYVPGGMPMLVMNTGRRGLGDARVRRALAFAIDYSRIAEQAMSKYSDPAQSSLILPKGADEKLFDAGNVAANGWRYDLAESKRILEQDLHAMKGRDGVYRLPDGSRLGPWKVQTPNGWSDWQTAAQIVVESGKAAGFDLRADFPEANTLTPAVQNGNFDLAIWYIGAQTTAGTPWQRFRDVMDIRGVAPRGRSAFYNYGRFSDGQVAPLLDKAATATGQELKATLRDLDTIFMRNAPMIPLMYRPIDFFEYNESVWTGFPNEKEPTAPPTFSGAGVLWLYQISPR